MVIGVSTMVKKTKKWFWPLVLFTTIVWVVWEAGYPGRVIVHYDNPEKPIDIEIQTEGGRIFFQLMERYHIQADTLESGTSTFYLPSYYGMWISSTYTASLDWKPKGADRFTENISFISVWTKKEPGPDSDGFWDLNACRTDVYLDDQAKVVKVDVKYPKFLFSCF